jgi:hypothetical protein
MIRGDVAAGEAGTRIRRSVRCRRDGRSGGEVSTVEEESGVQDAVRVRGRGEGNGGSGIGDEVDAGSGGNRS